jgi:hypothetical protein
MMVLIAHGQSMEVQPNLLQKAVEEADSMELVVMMEALVEVLVMVILEVVRLKLVNQAIVEHTDLEMMVVLVQPQVPIKLLVVAVLVAQEMMVLNLNQEMVE